MRWQTSGARAGRYRRDSACSRGSGGERSYRRCMGPISGDRCNRDGCLGCYVVKTTPSPRLTNRRHVEERLRCSECGRPPKGSGRDERSVEPSAATVLVMSDDAPQYVTGWEREREHRGGIRGGLDPTHTMIPLAPLHAILAGSDTAVCGAWCRHVDDGKPWGSSNMGTCRDCRAALA